MWPEAPANVFQDSGAMRVRILVPFCGKMWELLHCRQWSRQHRSGIYLQMPCQIRRSTLWTIGTNKNYQKQSHNPGGRWTLPQLQGWPRVWPGCNRWHYVHADSLLCQRKMSLQWKKVVDEWNFPGQEWANRRKGAGSNTQGSVKHEIA